MGAMTSLRPPDDQSIRILYAGGLDERISEQDLRDNLCAHGEIETIKMVPSKACAFVTYTSREGAEKAVAELFNKLFIKSLKVKLMWGMPYPPKLESMVCDEAKQQGQPSTLHYFNIPTLPSQQGRVLYPSVGPRRM